MNLRPTTETPRYRALAELARGYLPGGALGEGWFELGGSSLDAARLVSRSVRELGVELRLGDLLSAGSLSEYFAATGEAAAPKGQARETGLAATGPVPAEAPPASGPLADGAPADGNGAGPTTHAATSEDAAAAQPSAAAVLWPALEALSVAEKLELAERLLNEMIEEAYL